QLDEAEAGQMSQHVEPRFLEPRVVIVIHHVEADHLAPRPQQPLGDVKADEAGNTGDEDRFLLHGVPGHSRHRSTPEGFAARSSFSLTSSTRPTRSFSRPWMSGQPPLTY